LKIIENLNLTIPKCFKKVNFDVLNLLNDLFIWKSTQSSADTLSLIENSVDEKLILSTLKILSQSTNINWFATREESIKILIQLFTSDNWNANIKHSPLSKLFLLCRSNSPNIKKDANKLAKSILVKSYMFLFDKKSNLDLNLQRFIFLDLLNLQGFYSHLFCFIFQCLLIFNCSCFFILNFFRNQTNPYLYLIFYWN
jgi:hypothetical protein